MQGEQVEDSIIRALNRVYAELEHWDVVVIIRGGGATSDLSGFDTYELATNCAQFPLPIITGIGHERDDTVIDMVAHTRVKTPTAAAEFLINHLRETAGRLDEYVSFFYQEVPAWLERQKERLEHWVARIPARVQMRLQDEGFRQERLLKRMHLAWQTRLIKEDYRLQLDRRLGVVLCSRLQRETQHLLLIEQQVKSASPDLLLQKGYSITLKDGKAVTDPALLSPGDKIVTRGIIGKFSLYIMATKKETYSEAMKRLEAIVAQIESNELDIDELAGRLQEAQRLIKYCREKLYKADAEIKKMLDEGSKEEKSAD